MKNGTTESRSPNPAAPATAKSIPGSEESDFALGQLIKAMEKVARPTAIQEEGVRLFGEKLNSATKMATNTGFEPIIGVIKLASPFFRERKQSICDKKKSKPSTTP